MKILIVEDEGILRFFLKNFLNKSGLDFEIIEADDGQSAIDKFESNSDSIDLIITDIKMPNMNGVEFIKKVRELNKKVPILIESGLRDQEFEDVKSEVDGVIKKPIEPSEVVTFINKYI